MRRRKKVLVGGLAVVGLLVLLSWWLGFFAGPMRFLRGAKARNESWQEGGPHYSESVSRSPLYVAAEWPFFFYDLSAEVWDDDERTELAGVRLLVGDDADGDDDLESPEATEVASTGVVREGVRTRARTTPVRVSAFRTRYAVRPRWRLETPTPGGSTWSREWLSWWSRGP